MAGIAMGARRGWEEWEGYCCICAWSMAKGGAATWYAPDTAAMAAAASAVDWLNADAEEKGGMPLMLLATDDALSCATMAADWGVTSMVAAFAGRFLGFSTASTSVAALRAAAEAAPFLVGFVRFPTEVQRLQRTSSVHFMQAF